ncbi:hypothetical protein TNCV_3603871 [Trichonephila clavipes]|nr:hypothetical protein TNCV_3603871 [Trichonephila clavipes]
MKVRQSNVKTKQTSTNAATSSQQSELSHSGSTRRVRDTLSSEESLWKTFGEYHYLLLPRGPPSHFREDHTRKQPLSEFCLIASCSSGIGNFVVQVGRARL